MGLGSMTSLGGLKGLWEGLKGSLEGQVYSGLKSWASWWEIPGLDLTCAFGSCSSSGWSKRQLIQADLAKEGGKSGMDF